MTIQLFEPSSLPLWQALLLVAPALIAAAAAAFASPGRDTAAVWRSARSATGLTLLIAVVSVALVVVGGSRTGFGLRADLTGTSVLLLVALVGWVIVRYSQPYLHGEHEERHYARWLMAALAAVAVVVVTNHVLILVLAWMGTSMAMHRLLNFFGHRPAAVVAAHKKFIAGRAADLCMLAAAALLASAFGTLNIDQIVERASAGGHLPLAAQAATLLVVTAALLKCAQLPFHGWLIQVMEAPTPVSALLHAGVVNLGGFVLIRFAPLIEEMPAAQLMLVAVGASTAVLAAVVMTTRISIKVMLAWSTCAQMGFMLMQCGLGAWDMALLHLLAHSLYKAHAFLGAGGAVRRAMLQQLTPNTPAPSALALFFGALAGVGMTLAASTVWHALLPQQTPAPAIGVLAGIVALALVPLVNGQATHLKGWWLPALLLGAFAVSFAYFGLHLFFAQWVVPAAGEPASGLLIAVALAFGLLFLLQCLITVAPQGRLVRSLYPWFYGGLFLDEKLTRIAFALWPPPAPRPAVMQLPVMDSTPAQKARS